MFRTRRRSSKNARERGDSLSERQCLLFISPDRIYLWIYWQLVLIFPLPKFLHEPPNEGFLFVYSISTCFISATLVNWSFVSSKFFIDLWLLNDVIKKLLRIFMKRIFHFPIKWKMQFKNQSRFEIIERLALERN